MVVGDLLSVWKRKFLWIAHENLITQGTSLHATYLLLSAAAVFVSASALGLVRRHKILR